MLPLERNKASEYVELVFYSYWTNNLDLDLFSTWGDEERIAVNVNSLYREYKGEEKREEITLLFQQMAELSGIDE